jgi:hypothetical protein
MKKTELSHTERICWTGEGPVNDGFTLNRTLCALDETYEIYIYIYIYIYCHM